MTAEPADTHQPVTKAVDGLSHHGIKPWLIHALCRDLATGDKTRAQLAREHGVTRQAMTKFAQRHADRIAEIRAHLDDEFAGIWIANKEKRIAAAERDYELSAGSEYAGHWEHVRTRSMIRKEIAEELGQLPPRTNTVVIAAVHNVVGIDLEDLK